MAVFMGEAPIFAINIIVVIISIIASAQHTCPSLLAALKVSWPPPAQVLAWLCCKVKRLRGALLRSSASFGALDDAALTSYAVGALGEYLSDAWLARLSDSCGLAAAEPGAHSPAWQEAVPSWCTSLLETDQGRLHHAAAQPTL